MADLIDIALHDQMACYTKMLHNRMHPKPHILANNLPPYQPEQLSLGQCLCHTCCGCSSCIWNNKRRTDICFEKKYPPHLKIIFQNMERTTNGHWYQQLPQLSVQTWCTYCQKTSSNTHTGNAWTTTQPRLKTMNPQRWTANSNTRLATSIQCANPMRLPQPPPPTIHLLWTQKKIIKKLPNYFTGCANTRNALNRGMATNE